MTTTKVTLSDGKSAIQVDGLPASPVYFRVQRTQIELTNVQEGVALNILFKAQAYQVDAAGVAVLDGAGDPVVGGIAKVSILNDAVAAGNVQLAEEWRSLAKQALRKLVLSQEFVELAKAAPTDLTDDSI